MSTTAARSVAPTPRRRVVPLLLTVLGAATLTACAGGRAPTEPAATARVVRGPVVSLSRDSAGLRAPIDSAGWAGGTGTGAGQGQTPIWW